MFTLGRVEKTREHLLADTIEISIAFGDYEQVSKTDTIGIVQTSEKSPEDLMDIGTQDLDDNDFPDDMNEAEVTEKLQTYVDDAFGHMVYRSVALGEYYPFDISGEIVTLKSDLSEPNKLYLFLLACSRTRTFKKKGVSQALADCFEEVSAACLKQMISKFGTVYMFGPNSDDRKNIFGSKLSDAIPALCKELGMVTSPGWVAPAGSSGDAKIDIIGVYGFSDTAKGFSVVIGQCASMEDEKNWERKRQEADFDTKRGTFHCLTKPAAALFIPVFYRSTDGGWINEDRVSGVIAVDRLRILRAIFADPDANFTSEALFEKAGISIAA